MLRKGIAGLARASLTRQPRSAYILTRSFATIGSEKEDVPLPINLYGLSARYANALYKTATRAGQLSKVESDLQDFKQMIETNPALESYIMNPVIARKDKAEDLGKICAGMSEYTRGFFGVLAENGRLSELQKIIKTFEELMKAQRGEVEATVITAESLTKKQLKQVTQAVTTNYLEAGKNLVLKEKIDPSIIGGLQVQIGDKFLDLSIQSKINKLHHTLAEA